MSLEGLSWIVIANGIIQLTGLVVIIAIAVRGDRDLARLSRGVAGLVYQESEKTRARLDELLGPRPR